MRPACLLSVRKLEARATFKQIDNCIRDYFFSHVHGQRERLQREMLAIAIDNHSWKPVAFAPHDTTKLWIDTSPCAVLGRLPDPPLEEIQIEILFPP